jgi:DNA polymerase III sliding clamp (beta) subunit (PCNA family)
MKQSVNLNVSDLQKFCNKAKSIVSGKCILPILDFIIIKEGKLEVTNLETTVIMRVDVDPDFKGTVLFSDVVKLMPLLKGGSIDLSIDTEIVRKDGDREFKNFHATLSTEIGSFSMDVADPDDYPKAPDTGAESGVLYAAEIPLVRKAINYAADDDLRPFLKQVQLHNKHVVATNQYLMCYYPVITDNAYDLLVSKEAVKLLDEVDYDINKTEDNVKLTERGGNFIIIYRTDQGFPDRWESMIPLDSSSVVTVKAKDIADILKASLLVIDKKGYFKIDSKPSEGVMSFACERNGKTFTRTVNTNGAGESIVIGLKHENLSRIIATEKTTELDFSFLDSDTSIIVNGCILVRPVNIK